MIQVLEDFFKDKGVESVPSNRIGASSLGEACKANIWYGFRWASKGKIPMRIARLFDRGNKEEKRIINDLRLIGFDIKGEQEEFVGFAGHAVGKIDGKIFFRDEWMLLEIKTMNDNSFKKLTSKGLILEFPKYYAQTQRYLEFTGLQNCIFLTVNKNDDKIHTLLVSRNDEFIEELKEKEELIVTQETPFKGEYPKGFFKCNWCNHKEVCHNGAAPERNCRTCKNIDLCENGKWECSLTGSELNIEEQKVGCEKYARLF